MDDELKMQINYQYQVYSSAQGLVPLADAKAGAVIGANLALVATLANAPFFIEKLHKIVNMPVPPAGVVTVFTAFSACAAVSALCALLVLFPRPSNNISRLRPPRLTFYEHVLSRKSPDRYLSDVKDLEPEALLQEMCSQNFELAGILSAKYRMSKASIVAFVCALVLWVVLFFQLFSRAV